MHTGGKAPAPLSLQLVDPTVVAGMRQVPPFSVPTQPEGQAGRRKILICHGNSGLRAREASALQSHGNEVIPCDPTLDYSFSAFERLLSETALVRFDCTNVNAPALRRLLHVCDHRQRHGLKPFFVCTGVDPDDTFKRHLERVLKVDRTVNAGDSGAGTTGLRDRMASDSHRWGVEISHRWWVGETICTPGEELLDVRVFNGDRKESPPLPMKDRLALDGFARGKVAQNRGQWAASLNANPWIAKHGSRARGASHPRYTFGRNGLGQSIWRIRSQVAAGFTHVGVDLAPMRIIESIPCGREVRYRWNPQIFVVWNHVEC